MGPINVTELRAKYRKSIMSKSRVSNLLLILSKISMPIDLVASYIAEGNTNPKLSETGLINFFNCYF